MPLQVRHVAFVFLILLLLILPSSAKLVVKNGTDPSGNSTLYESGYFHDSGYVPESYVWFAIIIGLISLVASTAVPKDINVFLLITPALWAYAAWYSAYMEREIVTAIPYEGNIQIVYTEVVFAQPFLQYVMIFAFLVSILYAIYVLFLQDNGMVTSAREVSKY